MSLQEEYPWQDLPVATLDERIAAAVRDGVERSNGLSGSVRDALMKWGERLLTRQALRLATANLPPDGVLGDLAWVVEAELAAQLAKGDSLETLHGLWELLTWFAQVAPTLGWYRSTDWNTPKLRFTDAELPALLVGRAIAQQADLEGSLLPLLELQQEWAPVAWALVNQGHDASRWLAPVISSAAGEEHLLTARIAWACAALGALPTNTKSTPTISAAFAMCVAGIAWFCPAAGADYRPVNGEPPSAPESSSPWFLSDILYLRTILYLAHAASVCGLEVSTQVNSVPTPITHLGRALGLPLRMTELEYRVLVVLCCPHLFARAGSIDEDGLSEIFSSRGRLGNYEHGIGDHRLSRGFPIDTIWAGRYLLPALWREDTSDARDLLLLPIRAHSVPLLLLEPARLTFWMFLYKRELSRLSLEQAASGWISLVEAARWRIPLETGLPAVEETRLAFLAHHGEVGWRHARSLLIERCLHSGLRLDDRNTSHLAMERKLLDYMNPSIEEWDASLKQRSSSFLEVAQLLMVGAPIGLLAELFLRNLTEQRKHASYRGTSPMPSLQEGLKALLAADPMTVAERPLFDSEADFGVLVPEKWARGPWLEPLLAVLPRTQAPDNPLIRLTRHLARKSEDHQVRIQALRALLALEAQHAAS